MDRYITEDEAGPVTNDLLDAENAKYRLVQDKTQTNYATAPAEPKENQSQSLTQPKSSRLGNY